MKKIFLIAIVLLSLNYIATAQEGVTPGADKVPTEPGQVPSMIMERFQREYPGISGNWSKEDDNYRVEFVDPQSHLGHIIIYDRNGDVIRRESELDGPSSPEAINEFYRRNYPGEQFQTWSVTDKDGTVTYYSKQKSSQLRFDGNGKPASTPSQDTRAVRKTKNSR